MVLNMLSTGAMMKIGKTYGNLMVDVQPTNAKLRKRAIGIVRDAAGVGDQLAETALNDADGEVKTAIVSLKLDLPVEEARERLNSAHGILRSALAENTQ